MKYILVILTILLCIVLGVWWFVNRELSGFTQETAVTSSDKNSSHTWQFAVIGDTEGVHPVTQTMIDDLAQQDVQFVIHVGDVSATGEESDFIAVKELFSTLPFPTYYIPGNNDLVYDEKLEIKTPEVYKKLIDDQLYHSFDHESAHFVLLDNSYRRYGFKDEELEWLKNDLDKNSQPLTFLFFHRPLDVPLQQLFGDDETPYSREQNEKFKTLIADYTIDHIFTGHLHTSLSYDLQSIPVTVTGGGGALPQDFLGGEKTAFFHYYIITVDESGETPTFSLELRDFNK